MNRKKVEEQIIKALTSKAEKLDFRITLQDYTSRYNHIFWFEKRIADLTFHMILRFMLPNYLKLDARFTASNSIIDEWLRQTCSLNNENLPLKFLNFEVEEYISLTEKKKKTDLYITNDTGYKGVDIDKTVNQIFERYFLRLEHELMPRLCKLEGQNGIINDSNNFTQNTIELSPFCFPIQNQVLGGCALAALYKPKGYNEILKNYYSYCKQDFKPGEDNGIDALVSYLDKVLNAKLLKDSA